MCFKKFQKFKFERPKPNEIWVDKSSAFSNRSVKPWLQVNNMGMYATHNKLKSVNIDLLEL